MWGYRMLNKNVVIGSMAAILAVIIFIAICTIFDPDVVIDKTMTPAGHAINNIIPLPSGSGTYCIHAETLSRGEPVDVRFLYRIATPIPADRFGSVVYKPIGSIFTTDNNHIVNETVTVPEGALDPIITVSYSNYISHNHQVHVIVKKC
jgi:hypothetical protein